MRCVHSESVRLTRAAEQALSKARGPAQAAGEMSHRFVVSTKSDQDHLYKMFPVFVISWLIWSG
jgi:hypothetical protein